MYVFAILTTTNQLNKNGYDSVYKVREPYVYPVWVRICYLVQVLQHTLEVPMLKSSLPVLLKTEKKKITRM